MQNKKIIDCNSLQNQKHKNYLLLSYNEEELELPLSKFITLSLISHPASTSNPSKRSSSSPHSASHNTPHVHFSDSPALSPMIEDDTDATLEASSPSSAFIRTGTASTGGVTTNLSRKKATLPQPTKKLVIKLNKVFFTLGLDFLGAFNAADCEIG